jgi:hypothetical protein
MGSDHQNASQIAIALFRDRPELLLAAGRILAWYDPDPGREVTTRSKNLRIRDRGGDGGGRPAVTQTPPEPTPLERNPRFREAGSPGKGSSSSAHALPG